MKRDGEPSDILEFAPFITQPLGDQVPFVVSTAFLLIADIDAPGMA
jgi:hypothetical protein